MNPELTRLRLNLPCPHLDDVSATVREELGVLKGTIAAGGRIAIAVGSRGIADLAGVVSATVEFVKGQGGEPFLVPAMGSHGGATAEGQAAVLAGYGITEDNVGAPVRSSMEVVELDRGESPVPIFMDRAAWESDGVILINRVKPHTDFHGRYESGLAKMCVVGLGNEAQAREMHRRGVYGLRELIAPAARAILATGRIIGGVALVENAHEETMTVRALGAKAILDEEPALLEIAREHMPRLPVGDIDILIIDRMGKDISGVGIDPNVIGRFGIAGQADPDYPNIGAVMVSDLTEASHGNALGVGLADVITRALYEKIDFAEMYTNVFASTFLDRAKIPVTAATDREALSFAMRAAHPASPEGARIMRIRDTLHVAELCVSASLLEELRGRDDAEVLGEPSGLFDGSGALRPLCQAF